MTANGRVDEKGRYKVLEGGRGMQEVDRPEMERGLSLSVCGREKSERRAWVVLGGASQENEAPHSQPGGRALSSQSAAATRAVQASNYTCNSKECCVIMC